MAAAIGQFLVFAALIP